jgi:hypothetical protein
MSSVFISFEPQYAVIFTNYKIYAIIKHSAKTYSYLTLVKITKINYTSGESLQNGEVSN